MGGQVEKQKSIRDLIGKNIIVYDLEIKNEVDTLPRKWASKDLMGISVGCLWDYREMRFRVFLDDNMTQLVKRLSEPETVIVAFNQIGFDNVLLREDKLLVEQGVVLPADNVLKNIDLCVISRRGARASQMQKGFKLDDHLHAMNLPKKTDDGANAPKLYQAGKLGELIDYCVNDVTVEKKVFETAYISGRMACAYKPEGYDVVIEL
jgi:hypothetical protein